MAGSRISNTSKPSTLKCGPRGASWRCIPLRGPHPDNTTRWYWTCRQGADTVWSAWLTEGEAQERFGATVNGKLGDPVAPQQSCLADLLNAWLDHQESRVAEREIWQRRRDEKEAASGQSAASSGARRPGLARGSLRRYEQSCVRVAQMLGADLDIPRVSTSLRRGVLARLEAGDAATTISSDLDSLAAAWAWGASGGRHYTQGAVLELPYVGRETRREKYTPSREEVLQVIERLRRPWMREASSIQLEHGCRIEAIADLTAERLDLPRGQLRLSAKGHNRWVPLTGASRAVLAPLANGKAHQQRLFDVRATTIKNTLNGEDWRSIAPKPWLRTWARRELDAEWVGEWQQDWTLEWLRAWSRAWDVEAHTERVEAIRRLCPTREERTGPVSAAWRRVNGLSLACIEAGCRRFTTHGIRRRTCTDFIASGMPVHLYSVLAGHSAQVALKHYADADRGSMEQAMGSVVRAWAGSSKT